MDHILTEQTFKVKVLKPVEAVCHGWKGPAVNPRVLVIWSFELWCVEPRHYCIRIMTLS